MPNATMILVPGAMHGSWTWDRVTPLLEAAGYRVIALDLPGMGGDRKIAAADVTLADWGEYVAGVVCGVDGPVILAGHSRGGLVIGEAAERIPERIGGLIYVTAMIPLPGQTGMEAGRDPDVHPTIEQGDAARGSLSTVPTDMAKAIFYNCCASEDAEWAIARLEPEPPEPLFTPATVSWERWGQVPRGYIECRQDRTLSLNRQRRFQAAAPCDPVVELDTDHSPFLSAPGELAEAMVTIAGALLGKAV